MNDYTEWKKRVAERICEKILKTIEHTLDNADKHLDMVELDELKDCWTVLCKMHEATK